MTRPILHTNSLFAATAIDKVERLLEVLVALENDPVLGAAFVLHGGTALNVFLAELPRLSVDLDLMYVGAIDRDTMLRLRPDIDDRFRTVVDALGYGVRGTNAEHSGQTYRLRYDGGSVKVDISYLARVALLDPVAATCAAADPPISFPLLREAELWAGKVKALTERTAARDLYDIHRLARQSPDFLADDLARALVIRAISASDAFPAMKYPGEALKKFVDASQELAEPLYSMLATDDRPSFDEMTIAVADLFEPLKSLSDEETQYLELLAKQSAYRPELLFAPWPIVLERAVVDPVMQWKVLNLQKRS